MTTTNDAPAQASVATWHPLDENGLAELRVNGKRVTTFPSYPAAEEAAQRINAALSPPPTVGAPAPSGSGVRVKPLEWHKPNGGGTLSRADTIIGIARVWTHHEANGAWFWSIENHASGQEATETDAKKMLWATYEHRILSALASDASPRGEAVAWMWVHEDRTRSFVSDPDTKRIWEETMKRVLVPVYAHPAPATVEMHGPFGHLVVALGLDEGHWRIEDEPVSDKDHVSIPMFTTVDPFKVAAEEDAKAPALAPATEGRKG